MVSSLNMLSKICAVLFPFYSCVSKITTPVLRVLIQWKDCKGRHIEVDALRWAWFRSRMRGGICKPHIRQILKVPPKEIMFLRVRLTATWANLQMWPWSILLWHSQERRTEGNRGEQWLEEDFLRKSVIKQLYYKCKYSIFHSTEKYFRAQYSTVEEQCRWKARYKLSMNFLDDILKSVWHN